MNKTAVFRMGGVRFGEGRGSLATLHRSPPPVARERGTAWDQPVLWGCFTTPHLLPLLHFWQKKAKCGWPQTICPWLALRDHHAYDDDLERGGSIPPGRET